MLNRRQFLLGLGSGAMLVGLAPVGAYAQSKRRACSSILVPEETWANSICQLCPSACGLRVRLANGHPVTVTGNPLHPVNRGGLCSRGAASLQLYYDPDRLPGPIRRDVGVVGGWAPVAWPEALARVAARTKQALGGGPGRVAVIRGDGQDIGSQLLGRFVRAADSEWIVDLSTPAERAAAETLRTMHGSGGRLVYDLANADFLLSIDSGLLESASATMTLHRGFAEMRSAGGSFVHAGPRMGVTGSKADSWLPIRPSTVGILALGVAHMLIKEGYERSEFLRAHTSGYYDWSDESGVHHDGVRSWLLRYFSPQRVAELTDVGWEQIIRVAREFGASERPLAIGPSEGTASVQPFDAMAVHTLNAVAGAIDRAGGVLLARTSLLAVLDAAENPEPDAALAPGEARPALEDLVARVLQSDEPTVEVVFIHNADPVLRSSAGDDVAKALERIPLVVSTSPVITDTVEAADIVLPSSLWIETRCDASTVDQQGRPVVSLSEQAARKRADTRNTADVVVALAGLVGGRVAEKFPWSGYDEIVSEQSRALYDSGVGDTFAAPERSEWTQLLERSGWRTSSYGSSAELKRKVHATGGWWDPGYSHGQWRRVAPLAGHRIDLGAVQSEVKPAALSAVDRPADGSLFLYVYTELALNTCPGGSLPYLQDISSPLAEVGWTSTADLNPETADRLAIEHGDRVVLSNEQGTVEVRVTLSPAIRPDVIAVHTGGGRIHGGRYDAGIGANPLELIAGQLHDPRPPSSRTQAVVRVKKTA